METISYKKFITQLTDKAYRADVPLNGSFELTPLCNLDCKMCYVHLQDPSVRHRMLSGKQWIGLMEQAISKGMMTALLTGGEAMTHPDFWEIYMYLINQGISIRLKTNGLLKTEENVPATTPNSMMSAKSKIEPSPNAKSARTAKNVVTEVMTVRERHALIDALQRS